MLPISPCEDTLGHHLMSGTSETGPTVVGCHQQDAVLVPIFFLFFFFPLNQYVVRDNMA